MAVQEDAIKKSTIAGDIAIALFVIAIVTILILPLPNPVIDFCITVNICLAIIVVMVTLYVVDPLEFTVFPQMLLVLTLFRLALNVATSRATFSFTDHST